MRGCLSLASAAKVKNRFHNCKMKLVRLIIVATLVAGTAAQCSLDKGCSWDKLPFYCNTPAMGVLSVDYLQIKAYSGAVSCGNLFREADVGGGINTVPYVAYPKAKAGSFDTIVMVDPDADMDGSFPTATAPGSHAPVRHWIQAVSYTHLTLPTKAEV